MRRVAVSVLAVKLIAGVHRLRDPWNMKDGPSCALVDSWLGRW